MFSGVKIGSSLKELEAKVHEQLFNNVLLLTYIYPPSKEFIAVFDRSMFVKNNKVAFHQLVYYLLNILNPEQFKKKVTSWPIYDMKMEAAFRKELLTYINELNHEYGDANIPTISASYLITPGGFKFTRFVLKLSQLVLIEHLKKTAGTDLIAPPKPHRNSALTNIILDNLKQKTVEIEAGVLQMSEEFHSAYAVALDEAGQIVAEQAKLGEEMPGLISNLSSRESVDKNLSVLEEFLDHKFKGSSVMRETSTLCEKADEMVSYLSSDQSVLEYVGEASRANDSLDLVELFERLCSRLEGEHWQMPMFSGFELSDANGVVTEAIEQYERVSEKFDTSENKLGELVAAAAEINVDHLKD